MTTSAGLLMFRSGPQGPQVLLAHPGGPFWARKDYGAWTLPKGEIEAGEEPLDAAQREFQEETGAPARGDYVALGEIRLKSGKRVLAWAFAGQFDPAHVNSSHFEMEWPPRSGRRQSFPEVDRVAWFDLEQARLKILPAQQPFIERLAALLA